MTKQLARKLGLNPGMRALIIDPPPGYLKLLTPLLDRLTVSSRTDGVYPFVQVFAMRLPEISDFAKVLPNGPVLPELPPVPFADNTGSLTSRFFGGLIGPKPAMPTL